MKYHMTLRDGHNMGDIVCFLDACRKFAHKNGHIVYVSEGAEIVKAYNDEQLKFGEEGMEFPISLTQFRKYRPAIEQEMYTNYLGQYMASMGIFEPYPVLELPVFETGNSYAVIQPFSLWAENPPLSYIQSIVDTFVAVTQMELFVIGKEDTPKILSNVNYSKLKNGVTRLMRLVQNSVFVLTPRSLTAHIAAGYNKPTFAWCPDDGLNWNLDYPGWDHNKVLWKSGNEASISCMLLFLKKHGLSRST